MKNKINIFFECFPRYLWHIIDRLFVVGVKPKEVGGTCIIRIGGIGDMILAIPLISGLTNSGKITTLLCDDKNKSIHFILKKYVNNIFYYNKNKLKKNIFYRFKTLRKLRYCGFDEVIQAGISRQQGGADVLAWACSANKTVGFKPREWNNCELALSDKWFDQLVDGNYNLSHELDRMEKLAINSGCNPGEFIEKVGNKKENFFVVCIGASTPIREWGANKFIESANFLRLKTGFTPIFVGEEKDLDKSLVINFSHINLIGKTSFYDLYNTIGRSQFIVTNDSAPMHIGVLLNVPTIAIVSGGEYNSYCNYPKRYKNIKVITGKDMSCYNCGWNCIYGKSDNTPFPCLSSVSVHDFISEAAEWLKIN